MIQQEIHLLLQYFQNTFGERNVKLVETHISWVILLPEFVYKIKQPQHYTFLDFSTLDKRKYYCEREVELNRRLTGDMYLSVEPVKQLLDGKLLISQNEGVGKTIDYAVKMRRKDESKQMNLLLERKEVTLGHMNQIAGMLADFHKKVKIYEGRANIQSLQEDFNDINRVAHLVNAQLGQDATQVIDSAILLSNRFLEQHASRIHERHREGFTIDGHGDLHSKNIFLLEKPVIFDCIEFSDHLRRVDILSEIAFFCMDLNYYGADELESCFLEVYNQKNPCILDQTDLELFLYYKLYRANVRVKVNALKKADASNRAETQKRHDLVAAYFQLMKRYMAELGPATDR